MARITDIRKVHRLSDQQIAAAAMAGGFRDEAAAIAVAVALAESSGNPNAINRNRNGSTDRGLWQINDKAHPDVSSEDAINPIKAAAAAYKISNRGTNWKPWVTYRYGMHRKYMARGRQAVGIAEGIGPIDKILEAFGLGALEGGTGIGQAAENLPTVDVPVVSDLAGIARAVASVASAVVKAGVWIGTPHNWVRIAEVLGGAVAVVLAINLIAKSGATGPGAELARVADAGRKQATRAAKAVAGTATQAATMAATKGAAGAPKTSAAS